MTLGNTSSESGQARVSLVSIADQLRVVLIERIVSGEYAAGSRLDPGAIAGEFGVSRTPVRDALVRLEHERLVETRPRSGTFVARPGIADVREVCQLRKGIEWVATGLASRTMSASQIGDLRDEAVAALDRAEAGDFEPFFLSDSHIHNELVAATGNSRLVAARSQVEPFVRWLRVLGATGIHRVKGSTKRHLEILDALDRGDEDAAATAAAVHLDEVEEWTVADMESDAIHT